MSLKTLQEGQRSSRDVRGLGVQPVGSQRQFLKAFRGFAQPLAFLDNSAGFLQQ
jgi:hypothetical protein